MLSVEVSFYGKLKARWEVSRVGVRPDKSL